MAVTLQRINGLRMSTPRHASKFKSQVYKLCYLEREQQTDQECKGYSRSVDGAGKWWDTYLNSYNYWIYILLGRPLVKSYGDNGFRVGASSLQRCFCFSKLTNLRLFDAFAPFFPRAFYHC